MNFKYALKEVNTMLGVLGTFLTIICLVDFNEIFPQISIRISIVIAIFVIAILIAIIKVSLTNSVDVEVGNGRKVIVTYGDLFQIGKQIVVPVNTCFDTLVNDTVIASKSIHGQFIKKYFGGNVIELDQLIKNNLDSRNIPFKVNSRKLLGKKEVYDIGTTAIVKKDGYTFYLLAITHFDDNNTAYCPVQEYYKAVISLVEVINNNSQGEDVILPLLGAGMARMNKEKSVMLENLLSVVKMSNTPMQSDLKIVLLPEDKKDININEFR